MKSTFIRTWQLDFFFFIMGTLTVNAIFYVVTLIILVFITQLESNVVAFGVQMFFSNLFNTGKVSVVQNTGMLSACA